MIQLLIDNALFVAAIVIALFGIGIAIYSLTVSASKKQVYTIQQRLEEEIRTHRKLRRKINRERKEWYRLNERFELDRISWRSERIILMDEIRSLKSLILQLQGKEVLDG